MPFQLTARDEQILGEVHPDLQRVIRRAAEIAPFRFRVLEGRRTMKRQRELVAKGASKTLNSRHLTGHAIDLAPYTDGNGDGKIDGADLWHWPLYHQLAPAIKQAAAEVNVPVEWGGDWRTFKDGPHWQLPWRGYPADGTAAEAVTAPPATEPVSRPRASATAAGAAAAGGAAAVVEPAAPSIIDALTSNEANLTSGDVTRVAFGVLIVLLTIWAIKAR